MGGVRVEPSRLNSAHLYPENRPGLAGSCDFKPLHAKKVDRRPPIGTSRAPLGARAAPGSPLHTPRSRTAGPTWPRPPGSSSFLVRPFKRDPLVCKGFSERCLQNDPVA